MFLISFFETSVDERTAPSSSTRYKPTQSDQETSEKRHKKTNTNILHVWRLPFVNERNENGSFGQQIDTD